jgi:hypothetical protein
MLIGSGSNECGSATLLQSLVFVSLRGATHELYKMEISSEGISLFYLPPGSRKQGHQDSVFEHRAANHQPDGITISYSGDGHIAESGSGSKDFMKKVSRSLQLTFFLTKNAQYCFFNTLKGHSGSRRCIQPSKELFKHEISTFFPFFLGPFCRIRTGTYSIRNTDFSYRYPLSRQRYRVPIQHYHSSVHIGHLFNK